MNFGGDIRPITPLAIASHLGTVQTFTQKFSKTFFVPGTFQLTGTENQAFTICINGPPLGCGSASQTGVINPVTVRVGKSEAFVAEQQDRALTAKAKLATLDLFGFLSAMDSIGSAVATLIGAGLGEAGNWGTLIGVPIGIAAGGYLGGPAGLLIASVYSVMGAYYSAQYAIATRLANDPPDPMYQQLYSVGPAAKIGDIGLGAEVNTYMQSGVDQIAGILDSQQGVLTSIERAQGAQLAGDTFYELAQSKAAEDFRSLYESQAHGLGEWLLGLPKFLDNNGLAEYPNISIANEVFRETGQYLLSTGVAPAVPEPSSYAMMVLGIFCLGYMAKRQRRIH